MIAHLKLTIAKLQRNEHGASSEKGARPLDQLEMQLGELVATVSEGKVAAALERPVLGTDEAPQKPARRSLDDKLPRERLVHTAPCACRHCGSAKIRKLDEKITETLELVPERWKVVQHVREVFTCRECDKITETPAPSHPIARGRAGPQLLAEVLHNKYRAHLPLNRQSALYAAQGVDLDVSTLADWVGACAATLAPIVKEIENHVLSAERIHADDTTVPVLAKGKCDVARLWGYVRDDRPFGGGAAPAALLHYSRDRGAEHPGRHLASYSGLMQADAYSGYNGLYVGGRKPGPIIEAACWAHGRRKFFELAELQKAPVAIEAVRRIDELFAIEREINGKAANERRAVRQTRSRPLVDALEAWLREERRKLSSKAPVAKAIDYSLKRWARIHALPRRRPAMPLEQRRRTRRARHRGRAQELDLLRVGFGRTPRRRDLHAHRDMQAQRCRCPGVARRRSRPHRRSLSEQGRRAPALELDRSAHCSLIRPPPRSSPDGYVPATSSQPGTRCRGS